MKIKTAIEIMNKVFKNMDKDYTIWEYRKEIMTLLCYCIAVLQILEGEDIE